MQVFLFDNKYAKQHKAGATGPWIIVLIALGSVLGFVAVLAIMGALELVSPFAVLALFLGYITALITWAIRMQPAVQAQTTAYVLDEQGLLWQVLLNTRYMGTSAYDLALQYYAQQGQHIPPSSEGKYAYFVQCARQGITHWNNWWGGEAKVTPLYQLQPISQTKRAYQFQYCDAQGAPKKLNIPKGYPTLFRHFWGEQAV